MENSKFPYTYISIVDGSKIHYDSMKIKHQKRLIELSENIKTNNEEEISFIELLTRICLDLIDIDESKLYYVDFEYLIFLIRGKTYGDKIDYTKKFKDKTYNFSFDIGKDFKIIGNKNISKKDIKLSNGNIVEISPLYLNEMLKLLAIKNTDLINYSTITYSLRKIKTNEEVTILNTYEEKSNYLNELEIEDLKILKNAYNDFPKLLGMSEIKIEGIPITVDFMDLLSNFFVFV